MTAITDRDKGYHATAEADTRALRPAAYADERHGKGQRTDLLGRPANAMQHITIVNRRKKVR